MVIYFVDNLINVVYQKRIITKMFHSINKGIIDNKDLFLEEFLKLIKKEKIKLKIMGDKLEIINTFYNSRDRLFLETIFSELGFVNISFVPILDYLPIIDGTYLEINQSYFVLYLDNNLKFDFNIFYDLPKIINYFTNKIADNIILFGNNNDIKDVNFKTKNVYYLDDAKNIVLKNLLKLKM